MRLIKGLLLVGLLLSTVGCGLDDGNPRFPPPLASEVYLVRNADIDGHTLHIFIAYGKCYMGGPEMGLVEVSELACK